VKLIHWLNADVKTSRFLLICLWASAIGVMLARLVDLIQWLQ
jgi:hypothetical protein